MTLFQATRRKFSYIRELGFVSVASHSVAMCRMHFISLKNIFDFMIHACFAAFLKSVLFFKIVF